MGNFNNNDDANNLSREEQTAEPVVKQVETKAEASVPAAPAAENPASATTSELPAAPGAGEDDAGGQMPQMSCVYGPVGSWRLGRSLGIDLLCTEQRTCNFDCVYCQLGPGTLQTERKEFVTLSKLFDDINAVKGIEIDWVTFSGMGEPTLATNLGEAISMAKSILGKPVAVLTNGSFIKMKDVRQALSQADMVVIKLDAFDDASFNAINRPSGVFSLGKMLQQWQLFRMEYKGKMVISIMLNDQNKGGMYDLQVKTRLMMPDLVHLNTPKRSDAMPPLNKTEFDKCKQWFWNFKEVINVFDAKAPVIEPLNVEETEKRHPTKKVT